MANPPRSYRPVISRALGLGLLLIAGGTISGIVWLVLTLCGFEQPAAGVSGVICVLAVCGILDFVVLVVCLALVNLNQGRGHGES